jgi:hypothetical protein
MRQLRRRPHVIGRSIVRKRTSPGSVPLVRFGKPALAATVLALLLGRDVHMQIKAGIERAIAAFLEEAPKAPAIACARPRKRRPPARGSSPSRCPLRRCLNRPFVQNIRCEILLLTGDCSAVVPRAPCWRSGGRWCGRQNSADRALLRLETGLA